MNIKFELKAVLSFVSLQGHIIESTTIIYRVLSTFNS